MLKYTGLFLLVVFISPVFSQDSVLFSPPDEYVIQYNEALQKNDVEQQVKTLMRIGTHYEENGMYALSEQFFRRALDFSLRKQFFRYVGNILNSIALVYRYEGRYEESLELSLQALKIEQSLDYPKGVSQSYYNIATVFFLTKDFEKALEYIRPSVDINLNLQDNVYLTNSLVLKALILVELKQTDEAIRQMDSPLTYYTAQNDSAGITMCYTNLAYIQFQAGRFDESFNSIKTAWHYAQGDSDQGRAIVTANLAEQYLQHELYDSALFYSEKALELATPIGLSHTEMNLYKYRSDSYKALNRYKEALENLEKHLQVKEKILSQENVVAVERMESNHQINARQKTIQLKEQEIRILERDQQISDLKIYVLLSVVALILSVSLIIYISQKRKHAQRQQLLYQEKQLESTKAELARVQLQKTALQNEKLRSEVQYKTKELENLAHHVVQKNELLENLKEELKKGQHSGMHQINQLINLAIDSDKHEFETHIDHINSLFYKNLKDEFPELNANDLRLLSLLKINMSSKDISTVLNIAPKSVDMARYRLRKKLNLPADINLVQFLEKY